MSKATTPSFNRVLWRELRRKQQHHEPSPIRLGREYAGSKYYYGEVGHDTRGMLKTLMRRRMRHVTKQRFLKELKNLEP